MQLKNETNAIFYGEPSGGKPNHYGEVETVSLPYSKLALYYSTKYFQDLQGEDPDSLVPDVTVEIASKDYFEGRDPVMEAILSTR